MIKLSLRDELEPGKGRRSSMQAIKLSPDFLQISAIYQR